MQNGTVRETRTADIELRISDFGPDCKILINGKCVASLEDHITDGVCETIQTRINFEGNKGSKSTLAAVEVLRNWRGLDRLVFTRYVHIAEGTNTLNVSYYGVVPERKFKIFVTDEKATALNNEPVV